MRRVKQWEIIVGNLSKAGWSYGYVLALDRKGRTIWIVDAHGYGKRFVVRSDEKLTAFLEPGIGDSHLRQIDLTSWRNFRQTRRH